MALNINGIFPGELSPSTTVAGCIDIFENVWPTPQQTIESIENAVANPDSGIFWEKAETIGQGPFQKQRTNDLLQVSHLAHVSNNSLLQNIHNQFHISLLAAISPYAVRYNINEMFYHEGYNLLRYKTGQEYKAHYDGGTSIGRAISALMYLNDDYEGGELEFVNFGIKIKPRAGMMILFPSNYAYSHISHPVISGTKYALVTWIKDRQL